jgi:hypothetical protein
LLASSPNGTWCERQCPSVFRPSTSRGPVQPFGLRSTITGQRGTTPASRAASGPRARRWIAAIESSACASVCAIAGCMRAGSSLETNSGS